MRAVAAVTIPVPILEASTTIQDGSAAMLDDRVEAAIVVDGSKLRAVVTARDVADGLAGRDVGSTLLVDIGRRDPVIVRAQEPLVEAHERMRAADAELAVVIGGDGRPIGVLPGDVPSV